MFKKTILASTILLMFGCTSECSNVEANTQGGNNQGSNAEKNNAVMVEKTALQQAETKANITELSLPDSANVLKNMENVANWQLPHIESLAYLDFKRGESLEVKRWVQGAFYIGLTEIAERSANPVYTQWISYKGPEWQWNLGPHAFFGDDQLIGQTYIWYYLNHDQNETILAPTKAAFDKILTDKPTTSLEFFDDMNTDGLHSCQRRWCWADALFMAPATWFGLSEATGDPRYAQYAHQEVKATVEYLFDPQYNLLYRDSRFKNEQDQFGNQLFWARGSGWVFADLARMMQFIKKDDPNGEFYETLFKKMAAKNAPNDREKSIKSTMVLRYSVHP